jgi:hypothetical protein
MNLARRMARPRNAGSRPNPGTPSRRGVRLVLQAGAAVLVAGLLAAAGSSGGSARAAGSAVRWGRAVEVPGLAALNAGGNARVTSTACWSAGNCAAGGFYTRRLGYEQAFLVSQQNGRWGKAQEVPGTAALNAGGNAQVVSASCARGGYCAAGGYYTDRGRHRQAFIVIRTRGRWGKAVRVPGLAALNTSGSAQVASVSCPSAGNCAAGGSYTDINGGQGFVVNETKYHWPAAIAVPGLATLNIGENASVGSLSCGSAGNCAAGGSYQTSTSIDNETGNFPLQAFVASERNGAWHAAEEVPGTAALNTFLDAQVNSVSCAPGGYCAAVGYYEQNDANPGYPGPFVSAGKNGSWGSADDLPGSAVLENGVYAPAVAVSCPSVGNCSAFGYISEFPPPGVLDGHWQAWVVTQRKGAWGVAAAIRGLGSDSAYAPMSCSSAGNCGAASGGSVATERSGRWGTAERVPGLSDLNKGRGGTVISVSCPAARSCIAAGYYTDSHKHIQAFIGGED